MNLGTIEITPEEATERLAEIEKLIVSERTVEDLALAQAYRAAKRGHGVVSLRRAFELAGTFANGLPKLGIARADWPVVRVATSTTDLGTRFVFDDLFNRWVDHRGALVGAHLVAVNAGLPQPEYKDRKSSGQTIVPLIPPEHRPRPRRLARCHILWEVEKWDPTPPVDPALVKHIRGDLWAVLATWDLTELERLVLTQRA